MLVYAATGTDQPTEDSGLDVASTSSTASAGKLATDVRRNPTVCGLSRIANIEDETVDMKNAIKSRPAIISIGYLVGNVDGVDALQRAEMEATLSGKKTCMVRDQANQNKDGSGMKKFRCRHLERNKCMHKVTIKVFTGQGVAEIKTILDAANNVRSTDVGMSIELETAELDLALQEPSNFDLETVTETIVFGGEHTCKHNEPLKLSCQTLLTYVHINKKGGFPDVGQSFSKDMFLLFKNMGLPGYVLGRVRPKMWMDVKKLMVARANEAQYNEGGIVSSAKKPRRSPVKNVEPHLHRMVGIGAQ